MAVFKINLVLSEGEARAFRAFLELHDHTGDFPSDGANEARSATKKAIKALAGHINARPDADKPGDMWVKKDQAGNHTEGSPLFVSRISRTTEDGTILHFGIGLSEPRAALEALGWKRQRKG
jgi:hypothetical protein